MIANDAPRDSNTFSEREALSFAYELEEVHRFLEQGSLLEKIVTRISSRDIPRLQKEYPTFLPVEIYQNPNQFQMFAITFILAKNALPGHSKMKVYVEMTERRVVKIFATS